MKVLLVSKHIIPINQPREKRDYFVLINLIREELIGKEYLQFLGVAFWEAVNTNHSLKYSKQQKSEVKDKIRNDICSVHTTNSIFTLPR